MNDYIAWIGKIGERPGTSVARGTLKQVKAKAAEIAASTLWLEENPEGASVRITRGARQLFAEAYNIVRS